MRILGLDYGEKRIGVAICDELGLTAQGLPTIIRKNKKHDWEILLSLISNYKVEKIVIGYPVRLDGSEGIQCEKVNRFSILLVKQSFDFWQRGPRSVLASFETIEVDGRPFFDDVEERWPVGDRPRAAGLGHAKYLILPKNSNALPGALFVVTTRDLGTDPRNKGDGSL